MCINSASTSGLRISDMVGNDADADVYVYGVLRLLGQDGYPVRNKRWYGDIAKH